jgi:hypothetical protein
VNSIKQSLEGKENDLVATPTSRANNALQSSKKSSSQDSSNGTKPAGFMNRIKDAIDSAQNKKPKPLDAEAQKQQDRERKQRLRDKGF